MPSRPACVAILLFWVYAAGGLVRRDVLPDFWTTPPPDLRTMAAAEASSGPTQWDLSVAEDPGHRSFRSVGRAVTETIRTPDGGTELISQVYFDSGGLLKGTPFAPKEDDPTGERLEFDTTCAIDSSGNLGKFQAKVRSAGDPTPLMTLVGRVRGRAIEVEARGPIPILNWTRSFPYEPRGLIQNSMGPIDRLPGLQVGQRWETRVVSPLTGRVELVKVEVAGKRAIQWDNNVVTVFEMVTHLSPISARTWVRRDGLVLRQEIPFPFVKLILERLPDRSTPGVQGP
ncbi:hypothetical protein P12x_004805 [Tundrisphaera lichenicola]|uniref:hypothetical protein n=1 Tax=Tundrisphaera lichenicola TaxID=2029860 RepID=UPI003EB6C3B8